MTFYYLNMVTMVFNFFLISGFVITMSLEKCIDFGDFIFRRWLRLFPAMLIASILILITAPFFLRQTFWYTLCKRPDSRFNLYWARVISGRFSQSSKTNRRRILDFICWSEILYCSWATLFYFRSKENDNCANRNVFNKHYFRFASASFTKGDWIHYWNSTSLSQLSI